MKRSLFILVLLILLLPVGLNAQEESPEVQQLVPKVLEEYPHDDGAYTQGLLLHEGMLYESTGPRPRPAIGTLREVELETGEVQRRKNVASSSGVEVFTEGLALVDDRLIQLTWRNQLAIVWDLEEFEIIGQFPYQGEGWGLCYDGEFLWMSDGSDQIFRHDPETFERLESVDVTLGSDAVTKINELECVDEHIYANVWQTDSIIRVRKDDGTVDAVVDASNLWSSQEREEMFERDSDSVLNGIAYNPETETFYLTGKLWSKLFEVEFVSKDEVD